MDRLLRDSRRAVPDRPSATATPSPTTPPPSCAGPRRPRPRGHRVGRASGRRSSTCSGARRSGRARFGDRRDRRGPRPASPTPRASPRRWPTSTGIGHQPIAPRADGGGRGRDRRRPGRPGRRDALRRASAAAAYDEDSGAAELVVDRLTVELACQLCSGPAVDDRRAAPGRGDRGGARAARRPTASSGWAGSRTSTSRSSPRRGRSSCASTRADGDVLDIDRSERAGQLPGRVGGRASVRPSSCWLPGAGGPGHALPRRGERLTPEDLRRGDRLAELAALLRRLHGGCRFRGGLRHVPPPARLPGRRAGSRIRAARRLSPL